MLEKILPDPDNTITMTLLKASIAMLTAGGIAYGGWLYTGIAENSTRVILLEKAVISINDKFERVNEKLDIALQDLKYHHRDNK